MEYMNRWQKIGFKKGLIKGQRGALKELLQDRFGELPAWALEKVESATVSVLDVWCIAILHKNTLEEVLSS